MSEKTPLGTLMGVTNKDSSNLSSSSPDSEAKYLNSMIVKAVNKASKKNIIALNTDSQEGRAEYSRLLNDPSIKINKKEGFVASFEDSDGERKTKDSYWKIVIEYSEIDHDCLLKEFESLIKSRLLSAKLVISLIIERFPELNDQIKELSKRFEKIETEIKKKEKEEN